MSGRGSIFSTLPDGTATRTRGKDATPSLPSSPGSHSRVRSSSPHFDPEGSKAWPTPEDTPGAAAWPEGRKLGRSILGELAAGGMATVYVARQVGVGGFERLIAIKRCHEHLRANQAFAAMFLEEARLAARIRHPNVVATIDVCDEDALYLVMEYVEGDSVSALRRRAARRGEPLTIALSLRIVMDVLAGLQAAHECRGSDGLPLGLIHCDVSPQNILVGVDGMARITDFGIARAARVSEGEGFIQGKLSYMAPEQLRGDALTQRVDTFAVGIILWEALTGRPLFASANNMVTALVARAEAIPPPSTVNPHVPPALDAIVLRALQYDPDARFASAAEFLTALEGLPLLPATARVLGDHVRREARVEMLASHWECQASPAPAASRSASSEGEGHTNIVHFDTRTRVIAPTPQLIAASRQDAEIDPPRAAYPSLREHAAYEAYRLRRLIVAIALILVGLAIGLLVTTSSWM
jgi:serine/threonine-protein kinase